MKDQTNAGYVLKSKLGEFLTHDLFWHSIDDDVDIVIFSPEETKTLVVKSFAEGWNIPIYSVVPTVLVDGVVAVHGEEVLASSLLRVDLASPSKYT